MVEVGASANHDDAFHLEVGFVYDLSLMLYEQEMYQQRYQQYNKELNSNNNEST